MQHVRPPHGQGHPVMLKQLICFVVGVTALGLTQPAAAAEYTLGLEGGVSSNLPASNAGPVVPGGSVLLNFGYVIQQRSDDQARNTAELAMGLLRFDSFSGDNPPGQPARLPYTEKVFFLAPGIRYAYTGSVVQPFFALHLGWAPSTVLTKANPEYTNSNIVSFGMQAQTGLQLRIHSRFNLGLGASFAGLGALVNKNFNTSAIWRGFAMANVEL
jgi:hypothetical protein